MPDYEAFRAISIGLQLFVLYLTAMIVLLRTRWLRPVLISAMVLLLAASSITLWGGYLASGLSALTVVASVITILLRCGRTRSAVRSRTTKSTVHSAEFSATRQESVTVHETTSQEDGFAS
ncbi:hypothetical protein [Streptomyces sp. NPDC054865]